MARTLRTIETHAGSLYAKKKDSIGRTYYTKEGEGRVKKTSWAAAKSHTTAAELKRGDSGAISDPSSLSREDLSSPYDVTSYLPVDAFEEGSTDRERAAEANRFFGFYMSPDTPDDRLEAMKEYDSMLRELDGVTDEDRIREIKEKYNVGGS